ncbi:hypothetical protein M404DRAFT_34416 [Pisolithus tinctorius Marx 270]|uniref:Uncharacterized protein n=1 Tax=Pisolithus tinctorius Marx 270 TaxID=870435 RepID=A0A0C3NIB4_PISTI|nr:hypothetical protein M404DRAFT_34416 [Pisolithus tinctorius Marx 270]
MSQKVPSIVDMHSHFPNWITIIGGDTVPGAPAFIIAPDALQLRHVIIIIPDCRVGQSSQLLLTLDIPKVNIDAKACDSRWLT